MRSPAPAPTSEWGVRLGILVIHNDPVPEVEMWRTAAPGVTVHTARFRTPRPFGTEFTGVELAALFETTGLGTAVAQLGDLGVDAVGYCFTSSSVFGGPAFDEGFARRAGELAGGVPVVTAGTGIREELAAREVSEVAVVAPPWFTEPTLDALSRYLGGGSVRVRQVIRFELPGEWDGIDRPDLFDRGARYAVDQDELVRQVERRIEPGADALLVPGSGFSSLVAAGRLGDSLGIGVVTANAALLSALERRAAGVGGALEAGRTVSGR